MAAASKTVRSLRLWQQQALDSYDSAGGPRDFLVTATPGAGKTTFALTMASRLLERRVVARVIVIAPTDHLRSQWAEAANAMGISLDPTLSNDVGPVAEDFHGYVATYAQVALKPMLHRRRAEVRPTLVIMDEVHHAGDGLSWGEAVREAFEPAKRRLCLTGTPFRSKPSETIPFVRYTDVGDGEMASKADYTYAYRHALKDFVVRPVLFAAYSGVARWRNSAGEVVSASLSEPLSKDQEMTAWRTALNPAGAWIPHVIAAADARLSEVRAAGMPDAGAMILASDQEHARAYATIIRTVTGSEPTLVLSEDPKASSRIDAFAASSERWLVAVRMVSEGVDVPRLAVGVWATNYRTPLFFAQAVGRFVRSRRRGETATVFLPAVRPLLALAAEMESERDQVTAKAKAAVDEEMVDPLGEEAAESASNTLGYEALEAEAEFAHVLFGGAAHTGEQAAMVVSEQDEEFLGLPGLLAPAQMATLLAQRDAELRKQVPARDEAAQSPAQVQAAHHQAAAIRREINTLVARLAAKRSAPHAQVHALVRKAVPGPASASASLAVLQERRDHLLALV